MTIGRRAANAHNNLFKPIPHRGFTQALGRMKIPLKLKLRLVDSVLKKPVSKDGVLRLGVGVEKVDSKIILFQKSNGPWLIVERREGADLICLTWNGNTHAGEARYPIAKFDDKHYRIKHYYGPDTIYYDGIANYARGYYLKIPYVIIHCRRALERAGTFLYNRRKLVLRQRLDLLTFMIEQSAEGKDSFSSLDLMTDMHSIRWITHPSGESVRSRLELYLDSLVDTGELIKNGINYSITGHALKLVEERAEHERRHKQGIKIQWFIAALTLATVLLALIQAGLVKLKPILDFSG